MRLASIVALVTFAGSASADAPPAKQKPKPPRAPRAAVIKVMAEAGQALVHDRDRGEYIVVRRGDTFAGHIVADVDDDQVVLSAPTDPPTFYVLPLVLDRLAATPLPLPPDAVSPAPAPAPAKPSTPPAAEPPAAEAPADDGDMLDPYAGDAPVSDGEPAFEEPAFEQDGPDLGAVEVEPELPAAAEPPAVDANGGKKAKPAPAKPAPRAGLTLTRTEFDGAMSDFHARSKEIAVEVEDTGIRITRVKTGSLFDRLGLRKNDLVVSIGGHTIQDIDQAALVYVDLMRASAFDVVVDRGGKRKTLHVAITEN